MDFLDHEEPAPRRRSPDGFWNLLTGIVLLGVVAALGLFWLLFTNPQSVFNPFPPPTMPAVLVIPAATSTPVGMLPPTWTPTATLEPAATETPRPTATLPPTATFFSLITPSPAPPTLTPTEPPGGYPFILQKGSPLAIANIAHPEKGCDWLGVAGQVFDRSGGPKTQLLINLGGFLNSKSIDPAAGGIQTSLTGVATAYGQAGYEFVLADEPISSQDSLWVQLVDQSSVPLSEKVFFETHEDCEKNLILINFKQVR